MTATPSPFDAPPGEVQRPVTLGDVRSLLHAGVGYGLDDEPVVLLGRLHEGVFHVPHVDGYHVDDGTVAVLSTVPSATVPPVPGDDAWTICTDCLGLAVETSDGHGYGTLQDLTIAARVHRHLRADQPTWREPADLLPACLDAADALDTAADDPYFALGDLLERLDATLAERCATFAGQLEDSCPPAPGVAGRTFQFTRSRISSSQLARVEAVASRVWPSYALDGRSWVTVPGRVVGLLGRYAHEPGLVDCRASLDGAELKLAAEIFDGSDRDAAAAARTVTLLRDDRAA